VVQSKHPKSDGIVLEGGGADATFELEVQSDACLMICMWIWKTRFWGTQIVQTRSDLIG
jgi:hypothetical protein